MTLWCLGKLLEERRSFASGRPTSSARQPRPAKSVRVCLAACGFWRGVGRRPPGCFPGRPAASYQCCRSTLELMSGWTAVGRVGSQHRPEWFSLEDGRLVGPRVATNPLVPSQEALRARLKVSKTSICVQRGAAWSVWSVVKEICGTLRSASPSPSAAPPLQPMLEKYPAAAAVISSQGKI